MIVRIVKMEFKPQSLDEFLSLFSAVEERIKSYPGCRHLELLSDTTKSNVLFTYSIWDSEVDLNQYRKSEMFMKTWGKTRKLFASKAEASSLQKLNGHKK